MRLKKDKISLQDLYWGIPDVKCVPGCHACCGPVPFAVAELEACGLERVDYKGSKCTLLGPEGCTVYSTRPFMCRIFGASQDRALRCPHADPSKRSDLLSVRDTQILVRKYAQFRQAISPAKLLKEAINSSKENGTPEEV